ncbi:hypothetical protein JHK82_021710 [Glycine max]|nr:hypothetical protein JHK82_021710 [Glycine max]
MGHEHSKLSEGKGSRRARFKERLRLHFRRRRSGNGSSDHKLLHADNFAGIALLALLRAEMKFKDKWIACLSLGEQTFRTNTSDQENQVERGNPPLSTFRSPKTNRMSSNTLVGYCEVDLLEFLTKDSDSDVEVFNLLDPSVPGKVVGNISISCTVEDYNEDGMLSLSEFSDLIDAFGNQVATSKKEELFKAADKNGDGVVSMDELASLLTFHQEREPLLNCCPVCGEVLQISDQLNSMIHLTLCFDEGTGNQVMAGGFLTDKQASYGWFFKLSEWAHFSSYDVGIRSGSSASHILVYDRKSQRLVEEIIDKKIVLSMRAIYQSKIGLGLMDIGVKELLQSISEKQGARMDSPESSADIPKFIESFKTFNEFFIRELKPGSRPIASAERDDVAVCAADCRLTAFKSVDDSTRFWIKGRKFSVQGLLGKEMCSSAFVDGPMVIFRLAPQVNPIAVNSKYCNVFTENKRVVSIVSTVDFGKVAFVAIGATMVGSITFTKKKGDYVKKGDENSIAIDEDLLANSARSLETLVSVGMRLGVSTRKLS